MHGYMGKILRVDLTAGTVWNEPLNEAYAREYVGGSGLAARYACDMVTAETDPLGPENPLIFMTGPLVGTAMPSAGRYSVGALSPATGLWGEANSGGFFGPELRFAGYDGIIITGKSDCPVWLSIIEGEALLCEATDLWGLDSYATQKCIRSLMGESRARVACIGPAGEHLAAMAAVMNDHGRAAARTGLGAVMGAKNLKAIGVRGRAKVPVANAQTLDALAKAIIAGVEDDMAAASIQMAGTAGYVDMALMYGDMPIRYYQQDAWDEASALSGVLMLDNYQNRTAACYRCPIACGRETRAPSYGVDKVDGPEYETLGALGSLVMVADLEAVIYAGHLCNLYGLDTISAGATIALACELFERGLLTTADTGGLEIRYGDAAMVHRLLDMMAHREGFGAWLADGSYALAARLGVPELAVTVNKLEVPMHDPRAFSAMAAIYALSPRGACHMQGDMYGVDTGQGPAYELGIVPGERFESSEEKGRIAARQQAWRTLYNALTLCQFQNPGVERLLAALNAVTGWGLAVDDLLPLGKRILTLKRQLNLRRGLTRAAERLPDLLLQPLDGGTEGNVPDLDALLAGAYAEYGWDMETGVPLV
ncbi:MAG TPA: aldehyde ferredoxin oxidoreductase family protein [Anaerolineae bacterium]|nr:aldehyde ferredoxin oxidoreductase family protein [Anaerolineae bacterium]HQK14588.1 aldehyde ferredoxin oxidoreductase family protein [Anaerolineae bacterium]